MKRAICTILLFSALTAAADTVQRKEILSDTYTIDRQYRSMEGPGSLQTVYLGARDKPELLWVTGVRTEMVGADGKTPQLPELMCHVNVDLDSVKHQALFGFQRPIATRLVTLSQGMLGVRLPEGFGFPVISNEPLILFTQVLNHNIPKPGSLKVRHRVTFEFLRDAEVTEPVKPLFNIGASGMVLLNDNPLAIPAPVDLGGAHGQTCLMASRAPNASGTAADYVDPAGRKLTGHWVVPPGKQVNHSDITWFMDLPYDVTLHYAAVHLHPFARSLSLNDVTTGKTIFTAKARNPKKGVGLDHVDSFTSTEGVRLLKSHKYELVSVYNNTSKQTHDSMASVFLGLSDPEFVRPDPATLASRADELILMALGDDVMLQTSVGDIGISLMKHETPVASRMMKKLIRAGALDGASISALTPSEITFKVALPADRAKLVAGMVPERRGSHFPGTLSLCGDASSDSLTFSVVVEPSPQHDGHCTPFARIGPGSDVLRRILSAGDPSVITLKKASIVEAPAPAMALSKPSM